jgi:hypothetical protein
MFAFSRFYPKIPKMDPIQMLQQALDLSLKSLKHDKVGEFGLAITSYYETISCLDRAINLLAKRQSSHQAIDMILEKKLKYSKRISQLLALRDEGLYSLEKVELPKSIHTRNDNYQFQDFHTVLFALMIGTRQFDVR